jgi:hypothetical protein
MSYKVYIIEQKSSPRDTLLRSRILPRSGTIERHFTFLFFTTLFFTTTSTLQLKIFSKYIPLFSVIGEARCLCSRSIFLYYIDGLSPFAASGNMDKSFFPIRTIHLMLSQRED